MVAELIAVKIYDIGKRGNTGGAALQAASLLPTIQAFSGRQGTRSFGVPLPLPATFFTA